MKRSVYFARRSRDGKWLGPQKRWVDEFTRARAFNRAPDATESVRSFTSNLPWADTIEHEVLEAQVSLTKVPA